MLQNPARVMRAQLKVLTMPEGSKYTTVKVKMKLPRRLGLLFVSAKFNSIAFVSSSCCAEFTSPFITRVRTLHVPCYRPLHVFLQDVSIGGIIMLRNLKPGEEEDIIEHVAAGGPKAEEEEEEPEPPEPFEWTED